jgi:hypothetical protein
MITGSTTVGVITAASLAAPRADWALTRSRHAFRCLWFGDYQIREQQLFLDLYIAYATLAWSGCVCLRRGYLNWRNRVIPDSLRDVEARLDLNHIQIQCRSLPDAVHASRGRRSPPVTGRS